MAEKRKKKELTIEEKEHRNNLRVLYCGVFVCAVFVWVFRFALSGIVDLVSPRIQNYYVLTFLDLLADGAAVTLPFVLFQKFRRDPFRPVFKEPARTEHLFLRCVIGALSVFCLSVCCMAVTDVAMNFLDSHGVHSAITRPDMGSGIVQNLFYILLSTVIYSFSYEFSFRGIAMGAMKDENRVSAVLVSGFAFALADGEPHHVAVRLVVGFLLGWFCLRVRSVWACMAVHAASQLGICLWWLRPVGENPLLENFLLLVSLVLGIGAAAFLFYPRREPDPQITSNRVSLGIIFKSFGIWLLAGLVAMNMLVFTFYMEPMPDAETPESGRQDPLFNNPTDRQENIPGYQEFPKD